MKSSRFFAQKMHKYIYMNGFIYNLGQVECKNFLKHIQRPLLRVLVSRAGTL